MWRGRWRLGWSERSEYVGFSVTEVGVIEGGEVGARVEVYVEVKVELKVERWDQWG